MTMQHASLTTLPRGLVRLRIQLIYPEVVVLQAGLFVAMLWRGLDYVSPPNEEVSSLTAVEQAAPFEAWGAVFLIVGVLGLAGLRWPRYPLTAVAHGTGVALYFAFGVGALVSVAQRIAHPPSMLALSWIAVLIGSSFITFAIASWKAPDYRTLAAVGIVAALILSVTILASASGIYGWRTATGWLFVSCVGHAMMARASSDAWRDHHENREAPRDESE